jgi:mannosylglycerate hydrolase
MSVASPPLDVHVVSHTHWDREWYLTREQFRLRLVALMDRLLDLMESQADYRYFHLDGQTIVLEDYLELRPCQEDRLRRLIAEGRILVGPWYDMPDEFLVSGEALVRNLALGHRIARQFGAAMPVGYLPDLFGHVGQMPQILRQFGLDNAILWRGFGGLNAEYLWEAPDGSRVLMLHLPPEGYCNATRVHLKTELMVERATKAVLVEATRTSVSQVLLMNGVDHVEPHPIVPELARQLSESLSVNARHSTLPAYVESVRRAVERAGPETLETVRGELRSGEEYANLLPGVLSARVYLKQANVRVQTLLERCAEPLSVFASMMGAAYPANELRYAWKTLLQNHPHDSICGCSIDPVHEENMTRFARAEQVAAAVADAALDVIARGVPRAEPGRVRLVAVNTSAEPFAGIIDAIVDLPIDSAEPGRQIDLEALDAPVTFWPADSSIVAVTDAGGTSVPFQLIDDQIVTTFLMSRFETPWALLARRLRLLWRGDVPGCGYAVFDVTLASRGDDRGHATRENRTGPQLNVADRSAENEFLRIVVNDDGTVDVRDRPSGAQYRRCGELRDEGDAGDEYNYSRPSADRAVTSADTQDVRVTRVLEGPLRAQFKIDCTLNIPAALAPDRRSRAAGTEPMAITTWVSLDAGATHVDWRVAVDNRSSDHRLRLLFPVGADKVAGVRAETAFGVARRDARRTPPTAVRVEMPVSYAPTISFTEAGDATCGAIVFGEGLMEYEALTSDGTTGARLALTLLRAVGDLSRDDLVMRPSGHAGPGLPTPGAQCLGRHEFRLAFEPRGAPPPPSTLFARAAAFIAPPRMVPAMGARGAGGIPPTDSWLRLAHLRGHAVFSAVKRADDRNGLVVRLFNPDDTEATVRLRSSRSAAKAFLLNLLEERQEEVPVREGAVEMSLGPHRIATLEIAES